MPRGDRTRNQDLAAVAIASGKTAKEAGDAAVVSERTVFVWLKQEPFKARVNELRSAAVAAALGKLSDAMSAAAEALVALVAHADADVRHRAAVKVIELAQKLRSDTELEERLSTVERALKGNGSGSAQSAPEADRTGAVAADS
jgi:hypothetical protein